MPGHAFAYVAVDPSTRGAPRVSGHVTAICESAAPPDSDATSAG